MRSSCSAARSDTAMPLRAENCFAYQSSDERSPWLSSIGGRRSDRTSSIACRVELTSDRGCRSEEHTSELQSLTNLVCRLLLEKKKYNTYPKRVIVFSSHPDDDGISMVVELWRLCDKGHDVNV